MASEQRRRDERSAKGREWRFPAWFPALAAVACGLLLGVVTLRFVRPPGPVVAVSLTALRSTGAAGSSAPAGPETHASSGSDRPAWRRTLRIVWKSWTRRATRCGRVAFARAQVGI